jgi:hypothetical protein
MKLHISYKACFISKEVTTGRKITVIHSTTEVIRSDIFPGAAPVIPVVAVNSSVLSLAVTHHLCASTIQKETLPVLSATKTIPKTQGEGEMNSFTNV